MLSETFASPDNAPPGVADIYTDLDTTQLEQVTQEEDLRLFVRRLAQERRVSVQAMADGKARLLLLGDPGAGKSTFVKHLAFLLATALQSSDPQTVLARLEPWSHGLLLPVYVELRAVGAYAAEQKIEQGDARLFKRYLQHLLGEWGVSEAWSVLSQALEDGRTNALLLLDGLDEVGTNQRKLLVEMINAVLADSHYRRHRCIVTCRPYAYYDTAKDWRLRGFAEIMLAPFSEEQVERFVDNWYNRLASGPAPAFSMGEADKRCRDLKAAVRRKDHRSLARRPILLTMMVQLHTFKGRLPNDRILLYQESVDLLLARWNSKSHGLPGLREHLGLPDLKDHDIKLALYHVAFQSHCGEGQAGADESEERTADIDEGELQAWVRPYLGGSDAKAREFVRYIRERAGLLVRHKTAAYTFPHRSIQEYLAAQYLVSADDRDYRVDAPELVRSDPVRWRDVFVLSAGCARPASNAVAAINELCPRDCPPAVAHVQQWVQAQIAAEALLELGELGVKRTATGVALWERVQGWLLACMRQTAEQPTAHTRAAAGRLLARLDEPPERISVLDPLRMEFCHVPAGPFVMGDGKEQHEYNVPYDYWIARYPVTAAQFAAFQTAGGYTDAGYWPEAQEAGFWKRGQFRNRNGPSQWGEPFDLPNHPVVGVSWYEALTFVRWLNETSTLPVGYRLQLSSEPEWEKAARGGLEVVTKPNIKLLSQLAGVDNSTPLQPNKLPKRRYPWGDDPDPQRANYDDTKIGSTSAVGCFASGASPYGTEEMSGNVWEWTRSHYAEYPYPTGGRELAQREDLAADDNTRRVLRGGAFDFTDGNVACAARNADLPAGVNWGFGFRVVLSPFTSGL